MIRISLNEEKKTGLTRLRRAQKLNTGEQAHYVLLSDTGKSVSEIAQHLSRNGHTVRLWLKRYLEQGITGLKTKKPPGWQINLLRDWFSKQGINACDNTIVKSLNKLGYVYKRFSKTLPANAPIPEQKKARVNEIVGEISKLPATDIEIMFVDESHFSNQPYVNQEAPPVPTTTSFLTLG